VTRRHGEQEARGYQGVRADVGAFGAAWRRDDGSGWRGLGTEDESRGSVTRRHDDADEVEAGDVDERLDGGDAGQLARGAGHLGDGAERDAGHVGAAADVVGHQPGAHGDLRERVEQLQLQSAGVAGAVEEPDLHRRLDAGPDGGGGVDEEHDGGGRARHRHHAADDAAAGHDVLVDLDAVAQYCRG
jgi:hypothetical protein